MEWRDSTSGDKTPAAAGRTPAAPSVPRAAPVAPSAPVSTGDVELVAVTSKKKFSLGGLSQRDALMLWIGAGVLAAAGGAAVVLKRLLGKKEAQNEKE